MYEQHRRALRIIAAADAADATAAAGERC